MHSLTAVLFSNEPKKIYGGKCLVKVNRFAAGASQQMSPVPPAYPQQQ
jgi:hypothetical protein